MVDITGNVQIGGGPSGPRANINGRDLFAEIETLRQNFNLAIARLQFEVQSLRMEITELKNQRSISEYHFGTYVPNPDMPVHICGRPTPQYIPDPKNPIVMHSQ